MPRPIQERIAHLRKEIAEINEENLKYVQGGKKAPGAADQARRLASRNMRIPPTCFQTASDNAFRFLLSDLVFVRAYRCRRIAGQHQRIAAFHFARGRTLARLEEKPERHRLRLWQHATAKRKDLGR